MSYSLPEMMNTTINILGLNFRKKKRLSQKDDLFIFYIYVICDVVDTFEESFYILIFV